MERDILMERDTRPEWMKALENETPRSRSVKKEKNLAKRLSKGRTYTNSGATFKQNDIASEHMDIEHKFTDKKSYSLQLATLEKLEKQTPVGKIPVLVIEFGNGKEYAVIQLADLNSQFEK